MKDVELDRQIIDLLGLRGLWIQLLTLYLIFGINTLIIETLNHKPLIQNTLKHDICKLKINKNNTYQFEEAVTYDRRMAMAMVTEGDRKQWLLKKKLNCDC